MPVAGRRRGSLRGTPDDDFSMGPSGPLPGSDPGRAKDPALAAERSGSVGQVARGHLTGPVSRPVWAPGPGDDRPGSPWCDGNHASSIADAGGAPPASLPTFARAAIPIDQRPLVATGRHPDGRWAGVRRVDRAEARQYPFVQTGLWGRLTTLTVQVDDVAATAAFREGILSRGPDVCPALVLEAGHAVLAAWRLENPVHLWGRAGPLQLAQKVLDGHVVDWGARRDPITRFVPNADAAGLRIRVLRAERSPCRLGPLLHTVRTRLDALAAPGESWGAQRLSLRRHLLQQLGSLKTRWITGPDPVVVLGRSWLSRVARRTPIWLTEADVVEVAEEAWAVRKARWGAPGAEWHGAAFIAKQVAGGVRSGESRREKVRLRDARIRELAASGLSPAAIGRLVEMSRGGVRHVLTRRDP